MIMNDMVQRKLRQWGHRFKAILMKVCRPKLDRYADQRMPKSADNMKEDTGPKPLLNPEMIQDLDLELGEPLELNADCNDSKTQIGAVEDQQIGEEDEGENGEDDEDEDEDDEEEDEDDGRCDFKTIEAISDAQLLALALESCGSQAEEGNARVTGRTKGTFNFAAFIEISEGSETKELVLRIPGHGTEAHWTPEDSYMMEREVELINLLRAEASAPVPEIIDYADDYFNSLGFPYILMTKLPGKPAFSIWHDQPYDPDNAGLAFRTADEPSLATEKKRLTFLRSLARVMTSIQAVSFDAIGLPVVSTWIDTPYVGSSYRWRGDGSDTATVREAAKTTQQYIQAEMHRFRPDPDWEVSPQSVKAEGIWEFLNIIFSQPVFNVEGETFTIHHNDLDLQNILVDDEGNVTGIIDWEGSYAAPRCIGAAAVPLFLRNDWFPRYANDIRYGPHMAWNYHHYREIYAAAMVEAGNVTDAVYTLKSAIYQSALAAITEGGEANDLIEKLLRQIPHWLVIADDIKIGLGCGWDAGVAKLKIELANIFKPELPRPDFLKNIEADLCSREWMLTFEDYTTDIDGETCDEHENDPNDTATDVL